MHFYAFLIFLIAYSRVPRLKLITSSNYMFFFVCAVHLDDRWRNWWSVFLLRWRSSAWQRKLSSNLVRSPAESSTEHGSSSIVGIVRLVKLRVTIPKHSEVMRSSVIVSAIGRNHTEAQFLSGVASNKFVGGHLGHLLLLWSWGILHPSRCQVKGKLLHTVTSCHNQ